MHVYMHACMHVYICLTTVYRRRTTRRIHACMYTYAYIHIPQAHDKAQGRNTDSAQFLGLRPYRSAKLALVLAGDSAAVDGGAHAGALLHIFIYISISGLSEVYLGSI